MEHTIRNQDCSRAQPDLEQLWADIRRELSGSMTLVTFDSYIRPLEPVSCGQTVLTLYVPSPRSRAWIEQRLMGILRQVVRAVLEREMEIEFVP